MSLGCFSIDQSLAAPSNLQSIKLSVWLLSGSAAPYLAWNESLISVKVLLELGEAPLKKADAQQNDVGKWHAT